MAEKQDIAMNEFPINNVADYLYTEKGNNQQKVTPTDLVKLSLIHISVLI